MSAKTKRGRRLSLPAKFSRLCTRLQNPEWRRYGGTLFAGKMLGIGMVLLVMVIVSGAFLHPCLCPDWHTRSEGGRRRESGKHRLDSGRGLSGVRHAGRLHHARSRFLPLARNRERAGGMRRRYLPLRHSVLRRRFRIHVRHGNGFIGYHWFFLQNAPATYETTGVAFLAVWIFQFAFADTCSTITSGAMIGRTGFVGDLLYSICVTGFIYPIIGHWAWGPDGWLANMGSAGNFFPSLGMGFHDFAGSTVVHTIGGFIALGGRHRSWARGSAANSSATAAQPMLPHDLTIAVSGGLILWFGWYGFNPGSTLSAMDFVGIGRVATNTTLAACAAGLTSIIYGYFKIKKVGRQLHHERISGRTGCHYLPLLLGQPDGRSPARRDRWSAGDHGSRSAGMAAH